VAVEQSKRRWWEARHSQRLNYGVEIGGRFIAESALAQLYSGARSASVCAANARSLYTNGNDAGIESEILIVSRTASGSEYKARLTPDGDPRWRRIRLHAPIPRLTQGTSGMAKGTAIELFTVSYAVCGKPSFHARGRPDTHPQATAPAAPTRHEGRSQTAAAALPTQPVRDRLQRRNQ